MISLAHHLIELKTGERIHHVFYVYIRSTNTWVPSISQSFRNVIISHAPTQVRYETQIHHLGGKLHSGRLSG